MAKILNLTGHQGNASEFHIVIPTQPPDGYNLQVLQRQSAWREVRQVAADLLGSAEELCSGSDHFIPRRVCGGGDPHSKVYLSVH